MGAWPHAGVKRRAGVRVGGSVWVWERAADRATDSLDGPMPCGGTHPPPACAQAPSPPSPGSMLASVRCGRMPSIVTWALLRQETGEESGWGGERTWDWSTTKGLVGTLSG